ncbi:MAG: KilA-N domain-containing protein [Candidatus Roizmanbacteria bacterium]|nr:MAG: KilA-N domain-containing protein [Candidatus Roizmanbacteria bacterium]
MRNKEIIVKNILIRFVTGDHDNFISLTDIARYKDTNEPKDIVKNWMRTRSTIEFLGIWEKINNPNFKGVEFDAFKNDAGSNTFVLSPQKWIDATNAIGLISKSGRYGGGTFAHKDIAFEFASWISSEFKLFLIKEFQRLKDEENKRLALGWDIKRILTKINYKIHTDAIKQHIIPPKISKQSMNIIYANEADVLNMALFGKTAKNWRDENKKNEGNIRDYSTVEQLVVLSNLEGLNAEFIRQGLSQSERLKKLNEIAIIQINSLLGNTTMKKLL